jgi:hypothetical protein
MAAMLLAVVGQLQYFRREGGFQLFGDDFGSAHAYFLLVKLSV